MQEGRKNLENFSWDADVEDDVNNEEAEENVHKRTTKMKELAHNLADWMYEWLLYVSACWGLIKLPYDVFFVLFQGNNNSAR